MVFVGELVGGVNWQCQFASQLAVSVGGVNRRCQLAVLVGDVS